VKKLLFISILFVLTGCGTMPNDVSVAEIEAERDIEIAKEKTKQLELELEILKLEKK
jgi:starvation-inducible outer membrane lipoprotein